MSPRKLFGAAAKEALLLLRDRWGIAFLVLMPTLLVVIVTLAQEDAFKTMRSTSATALWVDEDGRALSRELRDGLGRSGHFDLVDTVGGQPVTRAAALEAVARGDYKVCLVVPKGASSSLRRGIDRLAEEANQPEGSGGDVSRNGDALPTAAGIELHFDPSVPASYRLAVLNGLARVAQGVEMKWFVQAIQEAMAGPYGASVTTEAGGWEPGKLLELREGSAEAGSAAQPVPTTVQLNVPGWTLLAMFLIAIPLSANIIRERDTGTLLRLRMLPASYTTILLGKVAVYLVFCLVQFGLILLLGLFLLPRLGTPQLSLGSHPGALALTAVVSGLAAMGFGILVGSVARTTDQASIFGAAFTIIAGAVGGIMVPVFLMPRPMQLISPYSPLHWGHRAFLDVLLRGAGALEILPDLGRLLAFSAGCIAASVLWLSRREGSPVQLPFSFRRPHERT